MISVDFFVEYGATFIECFFILAVLNTFFRIKDTKFCCLDIAALAILNSFIIYTENIKMVDFYLTMGSAIVIPALEMCLLKRFDFIRSVAISSIYYLLIALLDFLLFFILSLFMGSSDSAYELLTMGNVFRMLYILIAKILLVIVYIIFRNVIKDYHFSIVKFPVLLIVLSVSLYAIQKFCIDALLSDSVSLLKLSVGISCTMSILVTIFILMYLYIKVKAADREAQLNLSEEKNQLILKNYREVAKAHHDYKNQLNTIYNLLNEEKTGQAKSYIENLISVIKGENSNIKTKYEVLDAVLNSKITEAKKQNINIYCNIDLPSSMQVQENDLCTIIYNLLDNAITANMRVENRQERYIDIKIKSINKMLFIIIKNNFQAENTENKERDITHGYGISNIKKVVKKYDGILENSISEKEYTAKVMIEI